MPLYEYRCANCRRKFTLLVRTFEAPTAPPCKYCESTATRRLISRVAQLRSEESRMEALADPSNLSGVDENDPASLGQWMRRMGSEMGEELGPEFNEMVDRLEAGESPESIEASMPDFGGEGDLSPGLDDLG